MKGNGISTDQREGRYREVIVELEGAVQERQNSFGEHLQGPSCFLTLKLSESGVSVAMRLGKAGSSESWMDDKLNVISGFISESYSKRRGVTNYESKSAFGTRFLSKHIYLEGSRRHEETQPLFKTFVEAEEWTFYLAPILNGKMDEATALREIESSAHSTFFGTLRSGKGQAGLVCRNLALIRSK